MFSIKIFLAVIADLLIGDPSCYPHPVRCIGYLINIFEKLTRKIFSFNLYLAGAITAFLVLGSVFLALKIIFFLTSAVSSFFTEIVGVFCIYTAISIKDLRSESFQVFIPLVQRENINRARTRLSRIVGRDTAMLDREGVIKGVVETVAENSSDGITAPLFWAVVFSIAANHTGNNEIIWAAFGCMIYKAVNTMDSMLGYKNEKYREFGFAPAKLDDLFNYIPARLTGIMIVAASVFTGLDYKNSWKILLRDSRNHTSPNAGFPEAAVAGALRIQLGGASSYGGVVCEKPTIGDMSGAVQAEDILAVNKLVFYSSIIFLIFILLVKVMLQLVW